MSKKISISSVGLYQKCARAFDLRYNKGLRRVSGGVGARDLGSAVHGLLHETLLFLHKSDYRKPSAGYAPIVELARNLWGDANEPDFDLVDGFGNILVDPADWEHLLDEAEGITLRFIEHLDPAENIRVLSDREGQPLLEYHLEAELPGYGTFVGIVDAVWQHVKTGTIELVDFKTTSRFKAWDEYQIDAQLPVYARVVELVTGVLPDALVYWQIRPVAPKLPKLNKDGSMSRAKITSDWATYKAALLAEGLDPADYADMKAKLDADDAYWYLELVYTPSERMLASIWEQFLLSVENINASERFPGAIGYPCRTCDYRDYCLAEFNGDPTEDILHLYQVEE